MISKEIDQYDTLEVLEENDKIAKYLKNSLWVKYVVKTNCDDWHGEYTVECKIPMQNGIHNFNLSL